MSKFGRSTHLTNERRRSARHDVSDSASVLTIQASKSALLENLSRTGARLAGRDLGGVGKDVLVLTEELDVLGTVVWTRFNQIGVAFECTLEPTT